MKQYAVKDRDDSIHDEGSKRDALRSRKAYGGMVIRLKRGEWRPYKRRRVFLWVFLAVQVAFIIWLIAGTASTGSGINASVVAQCHQQAAAMGMTQAQCVSFLGGAAKTGTAIGAGLIVVVWLVVDIILGISYGVYRLATRSR
jgi:hypothetical protein